MKRKAIRALALTVLFVLSLGVITDALVFFGLSRGWQYLYNAAFFIVACPAAAFVFYKTDKK